MIVYFASFKSSKIDETEAKSNQYSSLIYSSEISNKSLKFLSKIKWTLSNNSKRLAFDLISSFKFVFPWVFVFFLIDLGLGFYGSVSSNFYKWLDPLVDKEAFELSVI